MHQIWRRVLILFLLIGLTGCEVTASQKHQTAVPFSTATVAVRNSTTGGEAPIQPLSTASPTPKPRPTPTHPPSQPPGGSSFPPGTSLTGQLEQQLFALINHDRSIEGLYPYVLNSTLSAGAFRHSVTMAGSCGISHQCPGEPDPCTRVTDEGISWTSCGENVGYTGANPTYWGGVQMIEQEMLDEQPPDDGHRLNLLNTTYHRVGVGIYIDVRGLVWITEDFAS